MNAKIIGVILLGVASVATALAMETETIAYFPLDTDARSIVNEGCNPLSVAEYWDQEPHSLSYSADVQGASVCDRRNFIRSNAGSLKLEKTRLAINLNAFPLSNDVDTVTIEMFVKGAVPTSYFLVFCLGPYADGMGASSEPQKPYVTFSPYGADGYVYAYGCPDASFASQQIFAQPKLFDEQWHHVAITIVPTEDGRSRMDLYLDGNLVSGGRVIGSDWPTPVKWTGGAGLAGHGPLYLYLGTRRSTVCLDEIRITKGVLPGDRWLKQNPSPAPVDGETLLYLPFDTDGRTIVHVVEDAAANVSAGLAFADDVGHRKAIGDGARNIIRNPNLASLRCDKTRYYYTPAYWSFTSNQCESATIEFFFKGSEKEGEMPSGNPVFRIGNDANSLRMVLQSYSDEAQGLDHRALFGVRDRTNGKTDGHSASVAGPKNGVMNDGKWHHVAMTTETTEGGAKGLVKFYFDYDLVQEVTLAEPWCAIDPGLAGDVFHLGSPSCVCSIDELRITKGALPPEKFLRKFSTDGLMLIFR